MPSAVAAARPALAGWAGRELVLGVRPEDFAPLPLDASAALRGEVLLTEITGADAYLFIDLPVPPVAPARRGADHHDVLHGGVTRVTIRTDPAHLPARGQRVALGIAMERAHFFDPASGTAIR